MAWVYLIVAGLFEIGWPVGLKLSQTLGRHHRAEAGARPRLSRIDGLNPETGATGRHRPWNRQAYPASNAHPTFAAF